VKLAIFRFIFGITLAWTPATTNYYKVFEIRSGSHYLLGSTGYGSPSFTIVHVKRGTHQYVVRAVNAVGQSGDSNVISYKQ